ncbi:MAG: CehA/McbA family metallohydrolase [Chloroflexota bacterium]
MATHWYRGNLHTHTTNSDGDSPPDVVTAWYRDAGYDFLALTDHDVLTDPDALRGVAGPMLLIHGEEVTSGDAHVNGFGLSAAVAPRFGADVIDTLQQDIDAIRAGGGVPQVNHPNYVWQASPADLAMLERLTLFEVFNGGPDVNNFGRPGRPAMDEAWDIVLTMGRRLWGTATDDAHHFQVWGRPYSNPGRGWVVVRATHCREAELLTNLEAGEFYATTGLEIEDLAIGADEIAIDIATRGDQHYTTRFIGRGGQLLDVQHGASPRYRITGHEGYVRARLDDSDGLSAWIQPRFL